MRDFEGLFDMSSRRQIDCRCKIAKEKVKVLIMRCQTRPHLMWKNFTQLPLLTVSHVLRDFPWILKIVIHFKEGGKLRKQKIFSCCCSKTLRIKETLSIVVSCEKITQIVKFIAVAIRQQGTTKDFNFLLFFSFNPLSEEKCQKKHFMLGKVIDFLLNSIQSLERDDKEDLNFKLNQKLWNHEMMFRFFIVCLLEFFKFIPSFNDHKTNTNFLSSGESNEHWKNFSFSHLIALESFQWDSTL